MESKEILHQREYGKKQTLSALLSMVGFIVLWAIVTDAWNYSACLFPADRYRFGKYLYAYFSRILWMLPACLLTYRFDRSLTWGRKQLFSMPKAEPVFLAFLALTTAYALAAMAVNYGSWHMTREPLLLLTIKLLLVGIGEEAVFRGWGYNLLRKVRSDKAALISSAFLFAALHWPAYFIKLLLYGQFDWMGILTQSISAFTYGILFSVMLRRSGTVWNPILAHFYYDWMLEAFT